MRIVIVGASDQGKVVADIVERRGEHEVVGYLDRHREGTWFGYEILGPDGRFRDLAGDHAVEGAVVAIGDNATRRAVATKITADVPGVVFPALVHPAATVARGVEVFPGAVVMAGAVLNPDVIVGPHAIVNTRASVDHDCVLGAYSSLAPGCTLGGRCSVGEGAAVALGASVIHGLAIGAHALVGAGSVVVRNVEAGSVVFGVPARHRRYRNPADRYL